MGVHGLWELLAPVGRRVSVETLAGKKLAIDASIWMVQFIKAMRDDRGEMVRNAHILGFFRRICKLLFLRTKPVFVFDGATPALKRRTLIARRRQRDNAQAKVRKTAEKLLLNHLKAMKLKELAEDLQNQKQKQKQKRRPKQDIPKINIFPDHNDTVVNTSEGDKGVSSHRNHDNLDEMLVASIIAEESGKFTQELLSSTDATFPKENGDEEIALTVIGDVDPDVLSSLPSSMQHEIQKLMYKNDLKNKKILSDGTHVVGSHPERVELVSRSANQQNLDEMLAASIMAEEAGSLYENASISAVGNLGSEDPDDEDEEMILPEMDGIVDPSVLAALPPSVQLDLLVQMRERLMAENRQRYQRVKKDPSKFSELQIQAYLKTVAFRRDIDQVQKAAAGRGFGGIQTSRIASEANREFIFSSSFTGDKQVLASTRAEKNGEKDQQASSSGQKPLNSQNNTDTPSTSKDLSPSNPDKSTSAFDENIETFLDERGRVRVSRVRAMGMRMTRDLERNLDLIKENEMNSNRQANVVMDPESVQDIESGDPKSPSPQRQVIDTLQDGTGESIKLNERSGGSMLDDDTTIEIFLEDDSVKSVDVDDNIFTRLAAENPIQMGSFDMSSQQLSHDDITDSDWEEGCKAKNVEEDSDHSFREGKVNDESEVEWEEGVCDHLKTVPYGAESVRSVSKGSLEEEADLQEAIRRSLDDIGHEKSDPVFSEHDKPTTVGKIAEQLIIQNENVIELENPNGADGMIFSQGSVFSGRQVMTENLSQEMQCSESAVLLDTKTNASADQLEDSNTDTLFSSKKLKENSDIVESLSKDVSDLRQVSDMKNDVVAEPLSHIISKDCVSTHIDSFPKDFMGANCFQDNITVDKSGDILLEEKGGKKPATEENNHEEIEMMEAELTTRISFLEQECLNLENEQKRLERNAESASSEMFAECQELLQMFGLPYIIAPMEAEAQCACLELANVVDGVVTDDSDVFLFGARSVYKNIFDDRKYVETYYMKDVENELGLNRDKLIRMALLLGSDYTEGISGIGIVNAIEVVNAFPEEDGLCKFREWIESPDPSILGLLDKQSRIISRKRGSKASENITTCSNSTVSDISASEQDMSEDLKQDSADDIKVKQSFMDKHRNVSKNWHIPAGFPSEAVITAYISPQVDKSAEPFSWGKPDHFLLRKLCWEKFGWDNRKADELLLPVLKEYNKHETQLRMEAFYTFNERFAKIRSKRIKKAVKGITGSRSAMLMDDAVQDASVHKQREISVERGENISEKCLSERENLPAIDDKESRLTKTSRKRQLRGAPSQPVNDKKLTVKEKGKPSRNKSENGRGRGRGTGRGRGRGRMVSRGKAQGTPSSDLDETSSGDYENHDEFDSMNFHNPQERRRSTRIRNPATYAMDDIDTLSNHSGERHFDNEAIESDLNRDRHVCADAVIGESEDVECNPDTLRKTSHEDHLETGGGFISAEDEMNQQGIFQDRESFFEANNGDDYLNMGGGFCLDDSNKCVDPDADHSLPITSNVVRDGFDHDPNRSTFGGQNEASTNECIDNVVSVRCPGLTSNSNSSRVDDSIQDDAENPTVNVFVGRALSAMPNLRRKRRKY